MRTCRGCHNECSAAYCPECCWDYDCEDSIRFYRERGDEYEKFDVEVAARMQRHRQATSDWMAKKIATASMYGITLTPAGEFASDEDQQTFTRLEAERRAPRAAAREAKLKELKKIYRSNKAAWKLAGGGSQETCDNCSGLLALPPLLHPEDKNHWTCD